MESPIPEQLHRPDATTILAVALVAVGTVGIVGAGLILVPADAPVSASTTDPATDSMGYGAPTVLLHVTTDASVGDTVVFETDQGLIGHRIVDETEKGYITRGDANDKIDQHDGPGGIEPVTDQQIVGVVVASVPLAAAVGGLLALLVLLVGATGWLYRRQVVAGLRRGGRAADRGYRALPAKRAVGAILVVCLVVVGIQVAPFVGLFDTEHDGTATAASTWDYTGNKYNVSSEMGTPSGIYQDDQGNWWVASKADGKVYKYDSDWSYTGTSYTVSEDEPEGIWKGPDGNWWVIGKSTNDVYKYTSDFSYTGTSYGISSEDGGMGGIYRSDDGFWWTVGTDYDRAYKYYDNWTYTGTSRPLQGNYPLDLYQGVNGSWYELGAKVYKYHENWSYTGTTYPVYNQLSSGVRFGKDTNGDTDGNWHIVDEDELAVYEYEGNLTKTGANELNGTVRYQDGSPVENATVSATFYDRDDPVLIDGEKFRKIVESPLPEQWDSHPQNEDVPTDESGSVDYKRFPQTADATVVLAHEGKDWGIRGYGPGNRIISLPGDQALPEPRRALAADHDNIAFSCWNPSARPGFSSDSIDSSIPNAETAPCTVHLRKLTPTGDVEWNRTLDSEAVYASRGASYVGWSDETPTAVKHHHAVPLDLEPGIYSVEASGSAAPPTVVAVAPNRDVTQLRAENKNWASSRLENITAYNERVQAEQNNGNLSTATTTTNKSGYYSVDVPSGADEADLTASKNPEQPSFDRTELTRQELTDQVESAVTTNFKAEAEQSVDSLENYRQTEGIGAFENICRNMAPIDEDVGGPYRGEREDVEVPQSEVDITGTPELTQGVEPPLDQCAALNLLESLFSDGLAWLDAGLLDDIENMSPEELRDALDDILPFLNANDDLREALEEETGITIDSDDPDDYSDDELRRILDDGSELIDDPGDDDDVPRGDGGDDGGIDNPTDDDEEPPNVGGGDDDDDTEVSPPDDDDGDDGSDSGNETDGFVSKEWQVVNVDDWDEAAVLVRLDWSNGSTTTLNKSSEFVSIDERTARPDRVRLDEYPWPNNGPEAVEASLSVADNSGVDSSPGSGTPNPTFDGDVPTPNHIRLSTAAPNSDQNVTVSVAGGEGFGQLADLNATGPNGVATTTEVVDNETARFRTNGTGTHRLELTLENPGGVQFTEVIRVRANSVQQPRPPTLKTSVGPTGRYPILSDGLTEGEVTVSDGGGQVTVAVTASEEPGRVAIHTTDADIASDATHTVEVRTGADQQQVSGSVGVILHQPKLSEDSLWYRNGDALASGEQSPNGQVRHENGSSVVDTFTDGNGEVEIRSIDNPGPLDRARHWADLTLPDLSLLAGLLPTPDAPAFPVVPLAGVVALPAGVLAGRRWSR